MAKLIRPSFLLYGSLVILLCLAVVAWWLANLALGGDTRPDVAGIPGMRSSNLYTVLESRGFRKLRGEVPSQVICKKGRQLVEVFETREGVSLVRVTVRPLFRTDDVSFALVDADLYGAVAMVGYEGAKVSTNQAWAISNFRRSAKRDDGIATLETRASDNIRILTVRPSRARLGL